MSRRTRAAITAAVILAATSMMLGAAEGALASQPAGVAAQCSWGLSSEPDTINVAYPDLDAKYWSHQFAPVTGERLVITGSYPAARYFSFHVYDSANVPLDSVYDARIGPDAGSSNPFRAKPKRSSGDRYTEYVDFSGAPSDPAPNTLYVGDTPQGTPTPTTTLMYRVYVPHNPDEPAGDVQLPQITLQTAEGATLESFGACSSSQPETGGLLNEEIANSNYPPEAPTPSIPEATDPPRWSRAFGSKLVGVFANQQNAYLKATISRQYGNVVVIHAKAPSFPDTRAGQPPFAKRQVRYWSICENNESTRVVGCAGDYHAALKKGYFTYVISDPAVRPANATAANGVTWLPWGGVFTSGSVILRNMLPAPTFAQAVQNVGESDSPQSVMGPYFPSAVYCPTATFEAGGWNACAGASPP